MGEQKRRRGNRDRRSSLIIPTGDEVTAVREGGTITTAEGTRRIDPREVDEAVASIAAEAGVQLPTIEDMNAEIDSMVMVVGRAIEADMKRRQVRTVSVLAALFRVSSNIAKTYLTQCAKQQILEQGVEDVVKLTEIQDADLGQYIGNLRAGMGESERPN